MSIHEPLYISAAHKSSGKTTLTIGLSAAIHSLNKNIQLFKKGPDYIDPLWHAQATAKPCYNLDYNTMSVDEILALYVTKSKHSDISIIEGNKGLYDGLNLDGSNSNAALAKLLHANIILVLDAQGMTRGIAPLVLGYQAFDPKLKIAGVILNKLGGSRHEAKLRSVLEHYTDVPVLGAVHKHEQLSIAEKHLGLIPSNEDHQAQNKIQSIARIIKQSVNLEQLIDLSQNKFNSINGDKLKQKRVNTKKPEPDSSIKIAVFKDKAFGFYYPADLEMLQQSGAELIDCSAINDNKLPDNIDGIFIGGGFPERHMHALASNQLFKADLQQKIESGLPCYAECGGLMYLARKLNWKGETAKMSGIIQADVELSDKPQGRGLIQFSENHNMLWPTLDNNQTDKNQKQQAVQQIEQQTEQLNNTSKIIAAHEFHYSKLINISKTTQFAYKIHRGTGIDGKNDAIVYKNLLASYAHLQDTEQNHWAKRFVSFIQNIKDKKTRK